MYPMALYGSNIPILQNAQRKRETRSEGFFGKKKKNRKARKLGGMMPAASRGGGQGRYFTEIGLKTKEIFQKNHGKGEILY
jgi:hypothetical protein